MLYFIALRPQVQVKNPYLDTMEEDILYHFSLGTKTHNLPEMFGDIKVCEMLIKLTHFFWFTISKARKQNSLVLFVCFP